ncbi:hypothetical protein THRCLA_21280, partial [Thraustotheca clavata]
LHKMDEELDNNDVILSREEYALLHAFHKLIPVPAIASGITRIVCEEELQVPEEQIAVPEVEDSPEITSAAHVSIVRRLSKNAVMTNLFQAVCSKRNFGVGQKVTRGIWKRFESKADEVTSFVEITRIAPAQDLKHGKAYGVKTFRGVCEGKERRLEGVLKRDWKVVA